MKATKNWRIKDAIGMIKITQDCADSTRATYYPDPKGEDQILGNIRWSILDCKDDTASEPIDTELHLHQSQIFVIESKRGKQLVKTLELTEDLEIQLCGSANQGEGFALNSTKRSDNASCWDWFNISDNGNATKLQEGGELELEYAVVDGKEEIVRVTFLTDVSLRMSTYEHIKLTNSRRSRKYDPFDTQWRLNIQAGSHITWPVIRDGAVVAFP